MKTEGKRLLRLFGVCYLVTVAVGVAFVLGPTIAVSTCLPVLVVALLLIDRRARSNKAKATLGGEP